MTHEDDIWTRRPRESEQAYEAFGIYRDLGRGNRSTAKVGQALGKTKNLMDGWSSRWEWVKRVTAYDAHIDAVYLQEEAEAVKAMKKRHAAVGNMFIMIAAEAAKNTKPESLTPTEAARWARLGSDIERLNRDMPSEIVQADVNLTDSPLMKLAREIAERNNAQPEPDAEG